MEDGFALGPAMPGTLQPLDSGMGASCVFHFEQCSRDSGGNSPCKSQLWILDLGSDVFLSSGMVPAADHCTSLPLSIFMHRQRVQPLGPSTRTVRMKSLAEYSTAITRLEPIGHIRGEKARAAKEVI